MYRQHVKHYVPTHTHTHTHKQFKMEDETPKETELNMEKPGQDIINSSAFIGNLTALNETSANLGRDEDLAKFEIAVSAFIFALAILGNGVVLIILLTRR